MDAKDDKYHQRCLELAQKGLGLVAPNPLVGALLVSGDKIIVKDTMQFLVDLMLK